MITFISSLDFIEEMILTYHLSPESTVFIVGDSCFDCAFISQLKYLPDFAGKIIDHPQVTYLIEGNGRWYMLFSFEEKMFFGFSPHQASI